MSISKSTTNITTLKVNYLTQEMYDAALENNQINENELYVTSNSPAYSIEKVEMVAPSIMSPTYQIYNAYYTNFVDPLDIYIYSAIEVTFDDIIYTCNCIENSYGTYFGAPFDDTTQLYDFSEYPFQLLKTELYGAIYSYIIVEESGTHTIQIKAFDDFTIDSDFGAAVNYVIDSMKIEGGSY